MTARAFTAAGPPAEKAKPRGAGGRSRGSMSKVFTYPANTIENSLQNIDAQRLPRRFGFPVPTARLVASLAGLGGAA